jgi:two-component system nitrogen regulation response regulator GlnG
MTVRSSHILVVDDEESICWSLKRLLADEGHTVAVASSAESALEMAQRQRPDLVFMDVRLPGMDGIAAIDRLSKQIGHVPIVVMTAFGNLETAVAAVEHGAVEYLTKPFDLDQAAAVLARALGPRPAPISASEHAAQLPDDGILGAAPAMQHVFKRIAMVAGTDLPVLVTGESGTGKELVARAIHRHSRRKTRPFVAVHLAALSPSLVESELFGHVRGAFTGADQNRPGLLELAHNATVFFDEAGDIPLSVQAKLLRVLEQQEITPVGATRAVESDFRVVAATNRDLRKDAVEGSFRQDLYFRLAAFEIRLPALRERIEDIPMLANHFLRSERIPWSPEVSLAADTVEELCRRPWPGNVRELRSAIEHGALLARRGPILPQHLPPVAELHAPLPQSPHNAVVEAVRQWTAEQLRVGVPSEGILHEQLLNLVETPLFELVLAHTNGNRVAAAELLGIHRATLRKKMS